MRARLQKTIAVCLSLCFIMGLSHSTLQAQPPRPITVTDAWTPPTLGNQRIGVVYFTIHNRGPETDRLQAITLPGGGDAQAHSVESKAGVTRMRPMDQILIPPGGSLEMRPGGNHVMLSHLPGPLVKGDQLKLSLQFMHADNMDIEAAVTPRP